MAQGIRRDEPGSAEAVEGARDREPAVTAGCVGSDTGQDDLGGSCTGKLLSPSRRRQCIDHVRQTLRISERRACRTLGQHRSTQRKVPCGLPDEERLTEDIIELTREFGRYGYRMITGMLNNSGWHVNHMA